MCLAKYGITFVVCLAQYGIQVVVCLLAQYGIQVVVCLAQYGIQVVGYVEGFGHAVSVSCKQGGVVLRHTDMSWSDWVVCRFVWMDTKMSFLSELGQFHGLVSLY